MDQFRQRATRVGVRIGPREVEALFAGAEWLAREAVASGLSQYDTPDAALIRAMGPALEYFAIQVTPKRGILVDLGAGNGAIGATIALFAPDLEIRLVDRAKRAYTACEMLIARMGLHNACALQTTADRLPAEHDVVVFRALARADIALELAKAVLRENGIVCAYHRAGDASFEQPAGKHAVLGTNETIVPGLVVTCYRR